MRLVDMCLDGCFHLRAEVDPLPKIISSGVLGTSECRVVMIACY